MGPSFRFEPESGRTIRNPARRGGPFSVSFSFIRTITVGSGITPDLLTFPIVLGKRSRALAETLTAGGDFHPALRTLTGFVWKGRGAAVNRVTGWWPITFCRLEQSRERTALSRAPRRRRRGNQHQQCRDHRAGGKTEGRIERPEAGGADKDRQIGHRAVQAHDRAAPRGIERRQAHHQDIQSEMIGKSPDRHHGERQAETVAGRGNGDIDGGDKQIGERHDASRAKPIDDAVEKSCRAEADAIGECGQPLALTGSPSPL